MTPIAAIFLLLLPGVLCAAVLPVVALAARRRRRGEGDQSRALPWWSRAAAPIVFVGALWSADFALHQSHGLWPRDGTVRYLAVALVAGLAGVAHAAVGRAALTLALRAMLGVALAWAVLSPLAGGRYVPWPVFWGLLAASGLWLTCAAALLDRADRGLPGLTAPVAMLLAAAVAAPGVYASTYAGGAQLLGGLGAAAGGAVVARLIARHGSVELSGGWTVWLSWFASVLLVTFGYTDVPAVWALPVLAMAPLGVGVGLLARGRVLRVAGAVVGVLVIAGAGSVAAALAAGDDGGGSSDDGGSYYGY